MHLQLYLRHFPPDGRGLHVGTCKAVHGLASGLVSCGQRVSVLCEGRAEGVHRAAGGYEIRSFAAAGPYRSFAVAPRLQSFIQASARAGPVLLVLNGIFNPAVYGVAQVAQRLGVPYVVAPHGSYDPVVFRRKAYLKWPYWYLFERGALSHAAGLQLLDGRQAQWARRRGIDAPALEVPNGLSPHDHCPEGLLRWRGDGAMRLLYWGRMHVRHKGLDLLLQAVAALRARGVPVELTLQGPDWHGERRRVQDMARRLRLGAAVRILGEDFTTPPPQVMAGYDAVCMPSRYEGFGLAALEAMAAGRPVLVTERAGVAPHVRRAGAGAVVEPTAAAVAGGLEELLARRAAWPAMGRGGRDYVARRLDWASIARRALDDYRRLVH